MSIKKFLLSTGNGDCEESELDSFGIRTIGYDDVEKKIIISNAHIIGNLIVSGSISGSLTGSVNGNSGTNSNVDIGNIIKFNKSYGVINVGDIVSIGQNGLARCDNTNDLLSNVFGVVYSSGSGEVQVQTSGEAEVSIISSYDTGSVLYASVDGAASSYNDISSSCYITQVGFISGNGPGKIIIQPRVFGQKA